MKAQKRGASWRVQATKTVDGRQIRRSFTAESKGEAMYLAERWKASVEEAARPENRTLREVCEDYIVLKEPILSPTTIAGYRKILRCNFQNYLDIRVGQLTKVKLQKAIADEMRRGLSAKSVSNAWGFVGSALRTYGYEFSVQLPEKADRVVRVPSPQELMPAIIGSDIELPCLLAMWCGLSMSEIRGARRCDIKDGVLYIDQVLVDVDGVPTIKGQGKEEKRTRAVRLPEYILDLIPENADYLVPWHRNRIYRHFKALLADHGLPDMTFHQLRHVFATTGAMLGIPSRVMQEKGGWKTPYTMQKVYQHTFTQDRIDADNKMDEFYEKYLK